MVSGLEWSSKPKALLKIIVLDNNIDVWKHTVITELLKPHLFQFMS